MAEKAKSKQIVVENPPPPKKKKSTETSTGFPRDIQFLGEALVKEANRINELELSLESLRKDIARVMGRMGL
tara:strand:- start:2547 stop:2762 length:216 start_codon:yes stop_codon:yes gene_type:complete